MNIGLTMAGVVKSIGKMVGLEFLKQEMFLPFDNYVLLGILYDEKDLIQHDLATILKKDKSGILRQIDALEKEKLLVRVPDTEDRRRKTIMLTKLGVKTVEKLRLIEASVFDNLMEGISDEELAVFDSVLKKMKSKIF